MLSANVGGVCAVLMSSFSAPSSLCLHLVLPPLFFAPLVTQMNAFSFDGSTEEERVSREREFAGQRRKLFLGLLHNSDPMHVRDSQKAAKAGRS